MLDHGWWQNLVLTPWGICFFTGVQYRQAPASLRVCASFVFFMCVFPKACSRDWRPSSPSYTICFSCLLRSEDIRPRLMWSLTWALGTPGWGKLRSLRSSWSVVEQERGGRTDKMQLSCDSRTQLPSLLSHCHFKRWNSLYSIHLKPTSCPAFLLLPGCSFLREGASAWMAGPLCSESVGASCGHTSRQSWGP
jgi:hypothetical protein